MMAKRHVDICNPNENVSQKDENDDSNINWDLCFICQDNGRYRTQFKIHVNRRLLSQGTISWQKIS